jgi:aspartate/methionine/tyrosine aminotransferase
VVVHPNNPTGHFTRPADRAALEELCREHRLALIVDEVFLDYGLAGQPAGESFAVGKHAVPTFVLSGLSKVVALPQMKAAWIACFARGADQPEALRRLEMISDTFLSMSAPIQCAIPTWLAGRATLQQQIRQRVQGNLAVLDAVLLRQTLMTRLEVEAGWYAVLRVPGLKPEEETALDLLFAHAVVIHPGGFFGFPGCGWLVVSLLAREEVIHGGAEALSQHFKGHS